jgi:hypothetical protein
MRTLILAERRQAPREFGEAHAWGEDMRGSFAFPRFESANRQLGCGKLKKPMTMACLVRENRL